MERLDRCSALFHIDLGVDKEECIISTQTDLHEKSIRLLASLRGSFLINELHKPTVLRLSFYCGHKNVQRFFTIVAGIELASRRHVPLILVKAAFTAKPFQREGSAYP